MTQLVESRLSGGIMSKTKQALALVAQGMNAHAAAKEAGIKPNSVYVALARQRMVTCPCCGSKVRNLLVPDNVAQTIRDWVEANK